jgi:hypothetical protein
VRLTVVAVVVLGIWIYMQILLSIAALRLF